MWPLRPLRYLADVLRPNVFSVTPRCVFRSWQEGLAADFKRANRVDLFMHAKTIWGAFVFCICKEAGIEERCDTLRVYLRYTAYILVLFCIGQSHTMILCKETRHSKETSWDWSEYHHNEGWNPRHMRCILILSFLCLENTWQIDDWNDKTDYT